MIVADVRITIAGRGYDVHCADGQEAQLHALAAMVDDKARGITSGTEVRQLLFAALMLADAKQDTDKQLAEALPAVETVKARLIALQTAEAEARQRATALEQEKAQLDAQLAALRSQIAAAPATAPSTPQGMSDGNNALLAETLERVAERIDRITRQLSSAPGN